jgi:[ribosomal protein S5]-alanine N-acetyltransferase
LSLKFRCTAEQADPGRINTEMELKILRPEEDKTDKLFESPDCQTLLQMYEDYYPKTGFNPPWVSYLIIRQNKVVGSCGFTGAPDNGKVEIAYWTFKEFEGQGIASFACKELVKIAQRSDSAVTVTAKTAPGPNASTRILQNNRFIQSGTVVDEEIGEAWLWTLRAGR